MSTCTSCQNPQAFEGYANYSPVSQPAAPTCSQQPEQACVYTAQGELVCNKPVVPSKGNVFFQK